MCDFENKYKKSSLELKQNGLGVSPFIKLLRFLGLRIKPLYYNSFHENFVIIYIFWFSLSMVLNFLSDEMNYMFLFLFPLFVSLVFSFYYYVKFKNMKLTPWRSL